MAFYGFSNDFSKLSICDFHKVTLCVIVSYVKYDLRHKKDSLRPAQKVVRLKHGDTVCNHLHGFRKAQLPPSLKASCRPEV